MAGWLHAISSFYPGCIVNLYLFEKLVFYQVFYPPTDNSVISNIPEELLEIFPDDGNPGSKRPKDKVYISLLFPFSKGLKIVSEGLVRCNLGYQLNFRRFL